jgi:putative transposase
LPLWIFFPVPTLTFIVLYCFFVIAHDPRRFLHFHVTRHPTSVWIAQQLREAFPFERSFKYLIFDRDAKFGNEVLSAVQSIELAAVRTSFKSPGRTEWRSAGWEVAGAIFSIT